MEERASKGGKAKRNKGGNNNGGKSGGGRMDRVEPKIWRGLMGYDEVDA